METVTDRSVIRDTSAFSFLWFISRGRFSNYESSKQITRSIINVSDVRFHSDLGGTIVFAQRMEY